MVIVIKEHAVQQISQEKAEQQLLAKYNRLHGCLSDLIKALNVLEPGGTLVDDLVITAKEGGKIRVAYVATPIQLTINTPERKFVLKVIEHPDNKGINVLAGSRIENEHKEIVA